MTFGGGENQIEFEFGFRGNGRENDSDRQEKVILKKVEDRIKLTAGIGCAGIRRPAMRRRLASTAGASCRVVFSLFRFGILWTFVGFPITLFDFLRKWKVKILPYPHHT